MSHATTISSPKSENQMLSQHLFGNLPADAHTSAKLNEISGACLERIYQTVYSGHSELAQQEWRAKPSDSNLRTLQLAFQSHSKKAHAPTEGQLFDIGSYYKFMRNEKLKNGRLVLWETLAKKIGENLPDKAKSWDGNQVALTFNKWIKDHEGFPKVDVLKLSTDTVPPEIGLLESLECLDLSENDLRTLPPEIGQLRNLETLHLHKNQLTTLPPQIGQLKSLKRLNVSENPLKMLMTEIQKLLPHTVIS